MLLIGLLENGRRKARAGVGVQEYTHTDNAHHTTHALTNDHALRNI